MRRHDLINFPASHHRRTTQAGHPSGFSTQSVWSRIWGSSERAAVTRGSLCSACCPTSDASKPVFRTRWASFRRVASTRSSTRWPASHSRFAKIRLMHFALRRAANAARWRRLLSVRREARRQHQPAVSDGRQGHLLGQRRSADNKYMISTYRARRVHRLLRRREAAGSTPARARAQEPTLSATAEYASKSTEDTTFPGFRQVCAKGQIICSCPITQAKTGDDAQGYQILGPYLCDKSFFQYCKAATATSKTGSTIYVGAPIGTAQALAVLLNGKAPPVNECREVPDRFGSFTSLPVALDCACWARVSTSRNCSRLSSPSARSASALATSVPRRRARSST